MKKIYILVVLMAIFMSNRGYAQAPSVTTNPLKFSALDGVTLLIDVTGTKVAGAKEPLYLWAWSDGVGDFATNGSWGSSSEAAKLVPVEGKPNQYTFTLPLQANGTTYNNVAEILGATPGQLKNIGLLIKTKVGDDTKKTDNLVLELDPLVFVKSFTRIFPSAVTPQDLVTLFMDQSLAASADVKYAMGGFKVVMKAMNAAGEAVGEEKSFDMKAEGNNIFSFTFFPTATAFPDVADLASIEYRFVSAADETVSSAPYTLTFISQ